MKKLLYCVMIVVLAPIITVYLLKALGYHPSEILRQTFYPNERDRNQEHRYDFPAENNGWHKIGNAPIYGDKTTGTIFDPYAYIDNETLCICASERASGALIKLTSTDAKHWKKTSTLLKGTPGSWEDCVNRGCIIKTDSICYLWYTGQAEGKSAIGFAKSYNGETFSRIQEGPIMIAENPFEGVSVMNPCVLWDNTHGVFKMWYSAGENYEPDVICYAESKDGVSWKKHPNPVMLPLSKHEWEKAKLGGVSVVQDKNEEYTMYYIGYQNVDVARICYATSNDGIHWVRPDNNLILSPSKNSWDADAVYKPSFIEYRGKQFLFYNGRDHDDEYLGVAEK